MTVATLLEAAGSGRSAPSAGRLKPYRYEGGKSAKPAVDLPSDVCNFRLSEVRNFDLTLTMGSQVGRSKWKRRAGCSKQAG